MLALSKSEMCANKNARQAPKYQGLSSFNCYNKEGLAYENKKIKAYHLHISVSFANTSFAGFCLQLYVKSKYCNNEL